MDQLNHLNSELGLISISTFTATSILFCTSLSYGTGCRQRITKSLHGGPHKPVLLGIAYYLFWLGCKHIQRGVAIDLIIIIIGVTELWLTISVY